MPGRAKEVHPKGDGFNVLWIQRVGVQFSDPAFNLKNALTRAKLSPEGLYATQIVAFWFRVTKRPKWTVCGAGNKTCFLLAAK